jgi:CRP/FNR family transcriptional regulator, cyclic AMP receptor protein
MKSITRINAKSNVGRNPASFDTGAFLSAACLARTIVDFEKNEPLFSQGDPCKTILYIQEGDVKISVVSKTGKEAVVGMLGQGDFIGEGGLAGQSTRTGTATATTPVTALVIDNNEMLRVLRAETAFSDRFIAYMLRRNVRMEENLIDQLFNSSEKRLARALLLLARFEKEDRPRRVLPKIPQETLAEMVGTTRSRVNFFMNKFKKLGSLNTMAGCRSMLRS